MWMNPAGASVEGGGRGFGRGEADGDAVSLQAAVAGAARQPGLTQCRIASVTTAPLLGHRRGRDIVSDAIATGAIQVPGSGQPVVRLADHQTTGGYPKIATVISVDLPLVGRRRPGDALRFAAVAVEEAEELARDTEQQLAAMTTALEPAPAPTGIDLATLYASNLISGIVSARD